jgi:predicted dehydrogenase
MESEDTCVATLEFANGALGVLHATTAAYPGYPRRIEITGTEGTVRFEHDRIVAADLRSGSAEELAEPSDANASANSPVVSDVRGHQRIIEDFIQAIESGRSSVCDGREGRRSLEVVEAIYQAARTRDAVACG